MKMHLSDRMLYSTVKIASGKKSVLEKNIPIIIDTLSTGGMGAVKHANGKDWWIIQSRDNSNQFYIFLFTKDGIVDTLLQTIGDIPPANQGLYGQTTFSSDGTRMIRFFPYTPIMNYTFDRFTGYFSNYSTFSVNYGSDFADQGGCAISPSGQYLYISALLQVYQFDLWATDISSSQVKVAVWDGFTDPIAISFLYCQPGPDCKIYIEGGGDTKYYHIIHNPDEAGLACNIEQRGLVFPIPSGASIPYFPNYRLGPIDNPGVPCSPVVATQQPTVTTPRCSVWPNPASSQLNFEFSNNSIKRIRLSDAFGRTARELNLSGTNNTCTISVSDLNSGVYIWQVEDSDSKVSVGKVLIH
ncbi:MAG: T9SS type A sorting domain-containing protein [Saprospiraceae bacterium]